LLLALQELQVVKDKVDELYLVAKSIEPLDEEWVMQQLNRAEALVADNEHLDQTVAETEANMGDAAGQEQQHPQAMQAVDRFAQALRNSPVLREALQRELQPAVAGE
jgi:hypothetical protein